MFEEAVSSTSSSSSLKVLDLFYLSCLMRFSFCLRMTNFLSAIIDDFFVQWFFIAALMCFYLTRVSFFSPSPNGCYMFLFFFFVSLISCVSFGTFRRTFHVSSQCCLLLLFFLVRCCVSFCMQINVKFSFFATVGEVGDEQKKLLRIVFRTVATCCGFLIIYI